MITYEAGSERIAVKLDGKHVGDIETVTGGYAYCTKDGKHWGETFPTTAEVKRSLEDD